MRKSQLCLPPGHIVLALSGRECGKAFITIRSQSGTTLYLADGAGRTYEKPKRKNIRHVKDCGKPPDADAWLCGLAQIRDPGARNAHIRTYLRTQLEQRGLTDRDDTEMRGKEEN